MKTITAILGVLFAFAVAATPAAAQAPQPYPNKVVKLIIGFPAGQATDILGRQLAERMSTAFGQPVIVENRPGQSGSMALDALARSAPDGYTMILAASGGLVTNPHMYKTIRFDPLSDFEPVAKVADLPLMLVTNATSPFDSVKALVEHARKNPGKLTYGSTGIGTTSHLAMESLQRAGQSTMVHVAYPGSVKALTDLMSGNFDVMFDTVVATRQHIQSGKLKLLAVVARERLAAFPNVPTIAEAGFPTVPLGLWIGMLFPKGTPADIVSKVSTQLNKDLTDPELVRKFVDLGAVPHPTSPKDFAQFIKAEYVRMGKLVQESGAKAD